MNASELATLRPAHSDFGHHLKHLRLARNLTQQELAEQASVSERLISDYERGMIHRPRQDTVRLLVDGLRLDDSDRERFIAIARGRNIVARQQGSLDTPARHALPTPITALVGRGADMEAVSGMLRDSEHRLITLTGPGGVGKTRLAIELAHQMHGKFSGGVYFVDLAPVRDPELVLTAVGRTLHIEPSGKQPLAERLAESLQGKPVLLVLDNLEHLLPAGPDLAKLLSACEQLKILVTSRAWLRIRAERPYQLEPLELPDLEALPAAGELVQIASVELFVDRAMAADREFALTLENARNIAEITVRLDGLPLAIELAVARLTVMSTSDLLRHLEHRIPFLTGGARDLPERLQALRAAIDWSYELLDSDEQRLFRRLAVFSGGFTLEAVERVNGGLPALDELTSLVQKSLVHAASVTAESRRFSLLETIREYGLERLAAADELAEARTNHLAWCLEFLERRSYDQLGSELIHWIRLLDIEHDNIRTSLTWAIESGQIDAAERLCGACYQYWIHRGLGDEGHRWLERVQQMEEETSPGTRAGMMLAAGSIAYARGEYEREPVLEKALQLYRETGNKAGMAITLRAMGLFAQDQSHFARAESLKRESLALFRKLGNDVMATRVLGGLGLNAYDRGDFEQAEVLLEEALVLSREQEIWITMASVLNNLALVAIEFGDLDRATALQQEALEEWRTLRYSVAVAHSLENLARIALRRDEWERGVVLFGASTTARIMIGTPGRLVDREENDKLVREVRSKVGEPAFNAYWEQGRSMTTDEAIDFALEDVSRP